MHHEESPQQSYSLSRRDVIKAGLAGVVLGAFGVFGLKQILSSEFKDQRQPRTGNTFPMLQTPDHFRLQHIHAEDKLFNEDERLAESLRQKYGIEVYNGPLNDVGTDAISGSSLEYHERVYFLGVLDKTLGMYPPQFMEQNGIRGIAFVHDLVHEGRRIGGINLPPLGIIQVDCDWYQPTEAFASYVHHEIYHQCDYSENGFNEEDSAWQAMHNCTCQVYESDKDLALLPDAPAHWFVEAYARKAPFEDRAKMAEWMMSPAKHRELLQRIKSATDQQLEILIKKYDAILADYYYFSNNAMNIQYWVDLLAGSVVPGYFS